MRRALKAGTLLLLGLALFFPAVLTGQVGERNPFAAGPGPAEAEGTAQPVPSARPGAGMPAFIVDIQRSLNQTLAGLTNQVQPSGGSFNPMALGLLLLAAFGYGVFHALGPGHGKTVVTAYFLGRPARLGQGLVLGYLIALVHAVVAIGIVLVILYVLELVFTTSFQAASGLVSVVSYAVIALLGLMMLAGALVELASGGRRHLHFHLPSSRHHHPAGGEGEHPGAAEPLPVKTRELVGLAVATAMVPCPGAATIMVFSIGLSVPVVGALAVASLSLGMGITTSLAGLTAIMIKRGLLKAAAKAGSRSLGLAASVFRVGGSATLFALGLLLFLAQLSAGS